MTDAAKKYKFVKKINELIGGEDGSLVADAVKTAQADPPPFSVQDYQDWSALIDHVEREERATQSLPDWQRAINFILSFFSTGIFFILLGVAILNFAMEVHGTEHNSFVFVFVVLGVAILLYGTGTQGVGSFVSTEAQMRIKGRIAGGAGLLAIGCAFFFVYSHKDIRTAFAPQTQYVKIAAQVVESRDNTTVVLDPVDHHLLVSRGGRSIAVAREANRFVLFVPYDSVGLDCGLDLELRLQASNASDDRARKIVRFIVPGRNRTDVDEDSCNRAGRSDAAPTWMTARDRSGLDFDEYEATVRYTPKQEEVTAQLADSPDGSSTTELQFK